MCTLQAAEQHTAMCHLITAPVRAAYTLSHSYLTSVGLHCHGNGTVLAVAVAAAVLLSLPAIAAAAAYVTLYIKGADSRQCAYLYAVAIAALHRTLRAHCRAGGG
jgi:hypothetical protein